MAEHRLLLACFSGHIEEAEKLLNTQADPCFQDEEGRSPLMAAAQGGHVELVKRLLAVGAPWNAIDKEGRCAGEYAMDAGQQEAIDVLLEAGVRAELLCGALERKSGRPEEAASSAAYLRQPLQYGEGGDGANVLMDNKQAVMMAWELPLMDAHANVICTGRGDVLNIGFGLGIIDEAIQRLRPRSHTIVEAHPDVLAKMKELGWDKKPGVNIVSGRWQDTLEQLGHYDGIFFDTYSEFYEDLREFQGHLPKLLRKGGLYSYFNGLAADNPFFHAVTCQVCKQELGRLGLATQFVSLPINVSDKIVWRKVGNKYWQLDTYFLPVSEWDTEN